MRSSGLITLVLTAIAVVGVSGQAPQWPQFRGPDGSGLGGERGAPIEFGPSGAVRWNVDLPAGFSSPVIWGDRIFVTAGNKETRVLEVLALDRQTGKTVWRQSVTAEKIEHLHEVGTPAQSTPVVDGERVYAYFGSFGLLCFDHDGRQKWTMPLPVANTSFGSGTSPVLAGDLLILNRDDNPQGYLLAVDRLTGTTRWKQTYTLPNSRGGAGAATPVLWRDEIIVHRGPEVVAYDRRDGSRKWWVTGRSTSTSTPVVGGGVVFIPTWFPVGEPDLRVPLPDFPTLLKQADKDGDGSLAANEFPDNLQIAQRIEVKVTGANITFPGKSLVAMLDADKSGKVEKPEWDRFIAGFSGSDHGLLAVKPGGQGDVTASAIVWREGRGVPEVPAPIYSSNRVYMVTNGGIVSCMDATTGKLLYRNRLGAGGAYYASPVMTGGHVYFTSGDGVISVIRDAAEFAVVARNNLDEPILATPAIVDGVLYVRTASRLYAFGK